MQAMVMKGQGRASIRLRDCGWEQCEGGHSYGPAVRDYMLIHVVAGGKGRFLCQDREYLLAKGQAFAIFPGQTSYYEADPEDPWLYYWFGCIGPQASDFLAQAGITPASPTVSVGEMTGKIVEAVKQIYEDAVTLNMGQIAATGGLFRLFALLAQCALDKPMSPQQSTYQRARWFMQANLQRMPSIEDVASHVGLSRSQLFRVFKAQAGVSPQEAMTEMRLEAAETLLRATQLPLKEVAQSAGFSSAARMGDVFRAARSVTPMSLRRSEKALLEPMSAPEAPK